MYKLAGCSLTLAVRPWPGPVVDEERSVFETEEMDVCEPGIMWRRSKQIHEGEAIPAEWVRTAKRGTIQGREKPCASASSLLSSATESRASRYQDQCASRKTARGGNKNITSKKCHASFAPIC